MMDVLKDKNLFLKYVHIFVIPLMIRLKLYLYTQFRGNMNLSKLCDEFSFHIILNKMQTPLDYKLHHIY